MVVRRAVRASLSAFLCPWAVALLFAAADGFGVRAAHASCGSANCFLVTGTQEGVGAPGEVVLDLS